LVSLAAAKIRGVFQTLGETAPLRADAREASLPATALKSPISGLLAAFWVIAHKVIAHGDCGFARCAGVAGCEGCEGVAW